MSIEINMAVLLERRYFWSRVARSGDSYQETATFGGCDCASFTYLAVSLVLLTVGTVITFLMLRDITDLHAFSKLSHMWTVGPIFLGIGLVFAIKCIIYLRRKSVIRVILHQQHVVRQLQDLAQAASGSGTRMLGPPSYEIITQGQRSHELPPPTYAEAVSMLQQPDIHDTKSACPSEPGSAVVDGTTERAKP